MKKQCRQTRLRLIASPKKSDLPDDLKSHFDACVSCKQWLNNSQRLEAMWQIAGRDTPSTDEVNAARQDALQKIKLGNGKGAVSRWFAENYSWKTAWVASLAVLVFAAGIYVGFLMRRLPADTMRNAGQAVPTWIIQAIQSRSSQLPKDVNTANLGLPQLLAFMVKYDRNAGHRLNSVDELASIEDDKLARDALIYALLNDKNPGVRMRAIKKLTKRPISNSLRDAYIYALWHDENPGIRLQAIDALAPVAGETEVLQTLQFVAVGDQDEGVRSLAREAIRHAENG